MAIQSQSLNQVHIWTVGSNPSQSFVDRDLESRNDSSLDSRDARSGFNRGLLDQEDTWRKIVISLTGKSKEQQDAKSRFNQGPLDQEDTWQNIVISLTGKSKESRDARLRKDQDRRIINNVDR
jgi:hypothetical protein